MKISDEKNKKLFARIDKKFCILRKMRSVQFACTTPNNKFPCYEQCSIIIEIKYKNKEKHHLPTRKSQRTKKNQPNKNERKQK